MDHDRLFKELLTTFFVEFLELFFPETGVPKLAGQTTARSSSPGSDFWLC
jgi:hypothetical protein